MQKRGIISFGAYIPRRRLARNAIAAANAWANPGQMSAAGGHRATCALDEDSLTMAVAAARKALRPTDEPIASLFYASTTMPFADRQNVTLIGEALSLPATLDTADVTGSLRAGVTALRLAFDSRKTSLVIASDKRLSKPGSTQEMRLGDASAAFVIGVGDVIAEIVATHALSIDFTDHYRESDSRFDYQLEERWVREQGYLAIVPESVKGLLEAAGVNGTQIRHFIPANLGNRDARSVAAKCGIAETALAPDFHAECGDTGAAHPLLVLTSVLQTAATDDLILLVGFGQGAEAILLRTTAAIGVTSAMTGADAMLAAGVEDDNYLRYLSINQHIEMDWGMRAERDSKTAQSAFFRHRATVTGCVGGRCSACGTNQFPISRVCVNPECRLVDTLAPEPFADKTAFVKSYTEDWLALSFDPPLKYGNVRFEGGGVAMLEFSDFDPGELHVGAPLELQFRLKDVDEKRGFRRYCWKAVPWRQEPGHFPSEGKSNG